MLLSLIACWAGEDAFPPIDVEELNFDHELLEVAPIPVERFSTDLTCPDNQIAEIFMLRPELPTTVSESDTNENESNETETETETALAQLAIIFPPNSFSKAIQAQAEEQNNVEDTGLAETPSSSISTELQVSLTQARANARVWQLLNIGDQALETGVNDQGTLIAMLANAGVAMLIPTNCWGDLWYNAPDTNPNAVSEEIIRQGRSMARLAVALPGELVTQEALGVQDHFASIDSTNVHWIGLGDGGRAPIELMLDGSAPSGGLAFDSTPADWTSYVSSSAHEDTTELLMAMTNSSTPESLAVSLPSMSMNGVSSFPDKTAWIWSNGDSFVPLPALISGAENITNWSAGNFDSAPAVGEPGAWITDRSLTGTVFSNADASLSSQLVSYLITGLIPDPMDHVIGSTDENNSDGEDSDSGEEESSE